MKKISLTAAALLALALPASAQDEALEGAPSPNAIVDAAPQSEWVAISAEDLLVMELAPDAAGQPRTVIIQLMPAPFSQGWVENIRTLARTEWYDGISINRVQDNYVVQWGDPNYDNPEGEGDAKPLPEGLRVMGERQYVVAANSPEGKTIGNAKSLRFNQALREAVENLDPAEGTGNDAVRELRKATAKLGVVVQGHYSELAQNHQGWPIATGLGGHWPVHCYGMVGVGRGYSPDTGSGAELYAVIGHAPRHLDRNIALVGRVIEGIEHMSSLPRGSGALGFYTKEEADKRTPIVSIRVVSDLAPDQQPAFEYLSTESETFAKYAEARANRRDPFFIVPAGGADICNIPVPIRAVADD